MEKAGGSGGIINYLWFSKSQELCLEVQLLSIWRSLWSASSVFWIILKSSRPSKPGQMEAILCSVETGLLSALRLLLAPLPRGPTITPPPSPTTTKNSLRVFPSSLLKSVPQKGFATTILVPITGQVLTYLHCNGNK